MNDDILDGIEIIISNQETLNKKINKYIKLLPTEQERETVLDSLDALAAQIEELNVRLTRL